MSSDHIKDVAAYDSKQMSQRGSERPSMTGSSGNENVGWLSGSTAASQRPSLVSGSPQDGQHPSLQQHVLHAGSGSLFRPPGTVSEYSHQRLYSPVYTTSPATPTALPPHFLQTVSASPIPTYNPFYPATHQFPPGYHSPLLSPRTFPIDSYSAVLASMGTHAAHAQQLPRFPSNQIPIPPSQYLGPTSDSTPSMSRPSPSSYHDISPSDPSQRQGRGISPQGKLDALRHPAAVRHKGSPVSPSGQSREGDSSTPTSNYKVPTGKEGSLKHRILTRPPDIHIQDSALQGEPGAGAAAEGSSPKRSKSSSSSASQRSITPRSDIPPSGAPGVMVVPPTPSQLHYPAHFMKGSIIQLANGELKRVEDLRTEDFVSSAEISSDLKIDSSTVVRIEESPSRGTAMLSFSVGENRVQVSKSVV